MPQPSTFVLFGLAALALLVTPGPAVLYIVARSLNQGRQAGMVSGLGGMFVGLAVLTDSLYAVLAGTFGQWLMGSRRFLAAQPYVTGGIYIGLGLLTALAGSDKK